MGTEFPHSPSLCARHGPHHSTASISLNSQIPERRGIVIAHLTDEETEAQKTKGLAGITQLVRGKARLWP